MRLLNTTVGISDWDLLLLNSLHCQICERKEKEKGFQWERVKSEVMSEVNGGRDKRTIIKVANGRVLIWINIWLLPCNGKRKNYCCFCFFCCLKWTAVMFTDFQTQRKEHKNIIFFYEWIVKLIPKVLSTNKFVFILTSSSL